MLRIDSLIHAFSKSNQNTNDKCKSREFGLKRICLFVAFYTADEKRKLDQKLRANTPPGFACAGEVPERMEGERAAEDTSHVC